MKTSSPSPVRLSASTLSRGRSPGVVSNWMNTRLPGQNLPRRSCGRGSLWYHAVTSPAPGRDSRASSIYGCGGWRGRGGRGEREWIIFDSESESCQVLLLPSSHTKVTCGLEPLGTSQYFDLLPYTSQQYNVMNNLGQWICHSHFLLILFVLP